VRRLSQSVRAASSAPARFISMAKSNAELHLLIPGLLGPMPNLAASGRLPAIPLIERLLARADQVPVEGSDFPSTLFGLFGIEAETGHDLPRGAVDLLGDGMAPGDSFWVRADPVHLRPDRDRLLLFDNQLLQIEQQESETLLALFNRHFADDGLELIAPHPDRWYLRLAEAPDLQTRPLESVVGRNIEMFLPQGGDARHWHRLLNEMQMLLFNAEPNRQRELAGRVAINGLWLSGGGRLPRSPKPRFAAVCSDDPTALGLARLAAVDLHADERDGFIASDGATLRTWSALLSPVLNADPYLWIEALEQLEAEVASLLRQGGFRQLTIYPCTGRGYRITSGAMRRLWRRARPILQLLESNHP